jgi:uncharacterized membrane protein
MAFHQRFKEVAFLMSQEKRIRGSRFFTLLVALTVAFFLLPFTINAAEKSAEDDNRPARGIEVFPEYPTVVVPAGEDVKMDVMVVNKGKADEEVLLKLTDIPKGWTTRLKTYSFTIKGVYVPAGETKTVTFLAEPKKETGVGDYTFGIEGSSEDGALRSENAIAVEVISKEKEPKKENIVITTSYPVLRGPSDAKFEFSLQVENKMDEDRVFNLVAQGPNDWEINFKPAYEDKYISSLRLKGGQSKSVAVQVKPALNAEAGEHPIEVTVSSGESKAQAKLKVLLTGTYKIDLGTITGLLSLNAQRGKEANYSLYLKNSGSAMQREISFLSVKPENWKVEFDPEKLENVQPGDVKQVEVKITPDEGALVGDYSVVVNAKGERASDNMELRTTVKASAVWGWVGVGIILLVIAGLCALFIFLGRR